MSIVPAALAVGAIGAGLFVAGMVAVRVSGAQLGLARRLAGPRQFAVGRLVDPGLSLPERPVRVAGRIRCPEPLRLPDGQRAVLLHRDVEVRGRGGWRSIERTRESRSFELWDHGGSVWLDPAQAAEPVIAIPSVWYGSVAELDEPHGSSARRLEQLLGPLSGARATTRVIDVTDRLLVVAVPRRLGGGGVALDPPPGGYVISKMALADAMRLLGGRHRRVAAGGVIAIALGVATLVIAVVVAGIGTLLGR